MENNVTNYLQLETDLDPKISGVRNGMSQAWINAEVFRGNEEMEAFMYGEGSGFRRGEFPPFPLHLRNVPMEKTAKHTDIISVAALLTGLVVSEKVADLLSRCVLPPHLFYDVTFLQGNKIVSGYYWFYCNLFNGSKYVDFTKSVFFPRANDEADFGGKIRLADYGEYREVIHKIDRGIRTDLLTFDKHFPAALDFFAMNFLGNGKYISQHLAEKLSAHQVSGYILRQPVDPLLAFVQ